MLKGNSNLMTASICLTLTPSTVMYNRKLQYNQQISQYCINSILYKKKDIETQ